MGKPKFVVACCGHTTTEEYLAPRDNLFQCCAKCRKKLDIEAAKRRLESVRHELAIWCETCKASVEPQEGASALLGVFWGRLTVEEAKERTLKAHIRHVHSDYDERREKLMLQGWSSEEARNIVRYGDPDPS